MRTPESTYRFQFTPAFTFEAAEKLLSYLRDLGISDLYASPIFRARPGSSHGYDVVDPAALNPDLGPPEAFDHLAAKAKNLGMGWLQDIVPNHMAFDAANPYLADILENGPASVHFGHFDIDWEHYYENIRGKVLAPFLGSYYGRALESGELALKFDEAGFFIAYFGLRFPLRIETYLAVLSRCLAPLGRRLGEEAPDYLQLLGVMYVLKTLAAAPEFDERRAQVRFVRQTLWSLYRKNPAVRKAVEEAMAFFGGRPGDPESFTPLENLLGEQWFRLSFWKVATEEINYRRFFSINDLISLRMEKEEVFAHTHALVRRLARDGVLTGLRVDHIDGLYEPAAYLERLRLETGGLYTVVEKILAPGEPLPPWPVQGTTGYDFLNQVNGVFCRTEGEVPFSRIYARFTGLEVPFEELVYEKKKLIIEKHMFGDINNLAHLLKNIAGHHRYGSDITMDSLKRSLIEVMALFPIYRSYLPAGAEGEVDGEAIRGALDRAAEKNPLLLHELDFIGRILMLRFDEFLAGEERDQWRHFVRRFQQFTGPLMAKGFEDTVLYVYNRLLSLNEVGGSPECFGVSLEAFHDFNRRRRELWPATLNATATHDTKRGEDMRARLNVLSEIPQEWNRALKLWTRLNRGRKTTLKRRKAPDRNDEYLFYQTLIGAWPFDGEEVPEFRRRLADYLVKAVREAKVHTAWLVPDTAYEEAFLAFAEKVLHPSRTNAFLREFLPFLRRVAHFGILNSLSQTLLKITSPGIPDFYQGTELWDLSLVDPDNRRPVDYESRRKALEATRAGIEKDLPALIAKLLAAPEDGRVKMFLIHRALLARRARADLFRLGDYRPLEVTGARRDHVIAFARVHEGQAAVTVVPRFATALVEEGRWPLGEEVWGDTALRLPAEFGGPWREEIAGGEVAGDEEVPVGRVLEHFPVALLGIK
jgi:(1->4)-alpha-D-glucan 1-alpha-D-glucosylmutase